MTKMTKWQWFLCLIGWHDWSPVERPGHPGQRRMCTRCLVRQEQYRAGFDSMIHWRRY